MSAAMVLLEAEVVALLAEGVDRNHSIVLGSYQQWSRPPRGGRG